VSASSPTSDRLEAALAQLAPELAARLVAPRPASRVEEDEQGRTTWRRFRHGRVLSDDEALPAAMEAAEVARSSNRPLLVLGLGDGLRLELLLQDPSVTVYAWDLDPAIWCHVLATRDLAKALSDRRLVPLLGVDLADCVAARQAVVVQHPTFAAAYADAPSLLDGSAPLALVVQGELFVDDASEALRAHGWRVLRWDISHLSTLENQHIPRISGARLALAINTQDGLGEVLARHGIPLAIWEIDPNTGGPAPIFGPSTHVTAFSYRRCNLPVLQRAGYRHVTHLPLAAPASRLGREAVQPPPGGGDYDVPIAFVGASMAESGKGMQARMRVLFESQPEVLKKLGRVTVIQREDCARWRVPELLETLLPGLRARIRREHEGLDLAMLVGEVCAAEKRLTWLAHLGSLGLHVWGDAGWSLLQAHGVQWRGWADHFTELPLIYRQASIHVDVPRLYQQDAVAMRIFDVMAAGGFLIAEHSAELTELFAPGVELETYRSPAELVNKCRFYLSQPELRARIAAAGRARVLSDHTIHQRIGAILGEMGLGELGGREAGGS